MRDVIRTLRWWCRKVSLALSIHPEFDATRRMTVLGGAAFVVVGVLASHAKGAVDFAREIPSYVARMDFNELRSVVRRAFVPRLYVQMWKSSPLMAELLKTA